MNIEDWVREEQVSLWSDLENDLRFAANGSWSIAAANRARRIVAAARFVGPTPNGEAPWALVASGVYAAVLRTAGIEPDLPDDAEWARLDALMAEHGGPRETVAPRFVGTLAAMGDEREQRWIRGEDDGADPA